MRLFKIVFWEFLLIFASVLVFRSVWMLLDRIPAMKNELGIWASLIFGAVVVFVSMFMINKYAGKAEKHES